MVVIMCTLGAIPRSVPGDVVLPVSESFNHLF